MSLFVYNSAKFAVFSNRQFPTWIVDESSQLRTSTCFSMLNIWLKSVLCLSETKNKISQCIIQCRFRVCKYCISSEEETCRHMQSMIRDQYRMTPEIGNFVGNCFYEDKLFSRTVPAKGDCFELVPVARHTRSTGPGKYVNESEIEVLDTLQKRAESYG